MEFPPFQPADVDLLVDFLCGEVWHFHVDQRPDPDAIRRRAAVGYYANAFWVVDGGRHVGLVRLMDLGEGTPMFDLRVRAAERGRGIGKTAVDWLTRYLFMTFPDLNRVEGTTRRDNHAMRRLFRRAGYVKEAHYREAWPAAGGYLDSIGYAILRTDWTNGTRTAPDWDDELALGGEELV